MSLETRARQEAQDALASVRGVNAAGRLAELKQQARTRRRASAVLAAAAVAVVMVVGTWLVTMQTGTSTTSPPPAAPPPTAATAQSLCGSGVTCLGNDRYTVALAVPVTLTLTSDFVQDLAFDPGNMTLDAYRRDGDAGVAVFEHAIPVKYDRSWTRDPKAGRTAESVSRWLSRRPFLENTTRTQTELGGQVAWHVTGSLKPGAWLPVIKAGNAAPTFRTTGSGQAAYGHLLRGEYTLLDVPGAGLTVVWSWTLSGEDLTPNQAVIDSLSFD
jgi:hypothetical protein